MLKNYFNNKKVEDSILNILIGFVVIFALYLILKPFYGEMDYYVSKILHKKDYNTLSSVENKIKEDSIKNNLNNSTNSNISNTENNDSVIKKQRDNVLYIPSIDLATSIQELEKIEDLHFGSWRRPNTSNPELGGNTVIVAHRYTDKGGRAENTFYNLPKVEIGEHIYTFWNNKKYTYKVYDIKVVESNDETVEKATTTANILTLYTCTPLWSSTHRHVVYSNLISAEDLK